MRNDQLSTEMLYHASLSPFKKLAADGHISSEELLIIDRILREKYSPIFSVNMKEIPLDI